jgi:3-oxoadipate enol-lactonase
MSVEQISLGSHKLACEVMGAGRPLVLLHGFPLDRRMWHSTAAGLVGHWQLFLPDLRGFGESALGTTPLTVDAMADDVAALMEALGLRRATVGGLSMGGYVAMAFALRHADRLDALLLADTKAGPDSAEARKGRDESIALVKAQGADGYLDRHLSKLLSPNATDEVRAAVRTYGQQKPESMIAGLAALRDRPDRRPALPSVRCPTLVIVGSEDALTPPAESHAIVEAIPGARLIEIPTAGHLANLEAPEAFATAVRSLA